MRRRRVAGAAQGESRTSRSRQQHGGAGAKRAKKAKPGAAKLAKTYIYIYQTKKIRFLSHPVKAPMYGAKKPSCGHALMPTKPSMGTGGGPGRTDPPRGALTAGPRGAEEATGRRTPRGTGARPTEPPHPRPRSPPTPGPRGARRTRRGIPRNGCALAALGWARAYTGPRPEGPGGSCPENGRRTQAQARQSNRPTKLIS